MATYDREHDGYRVFVGGISPRITKEELKHEFDRYGRINDVWVARNPPGFGFIVFKKSEDADKAVKRMNKRRSMGSVLRVEHANQPYRGSLGRSRHRDRSRSPPRRNSRRSRSRSRHRRSRSHDNKRRTSRSRSRSGRNERSKKVKKDRSRSGSYHRKSSDKDKSRKRTPEEHPRSMHSRSRSHCTSSVNSKGGEAYNKNGKAEVNRSPSEEKSRSNSKAPSHTSERRISVTPDSPDDRVPSSREHSYERPGSVEKDDRSNSGSRKPGSRSPDEDSHSE